MQPPAAAGEGLTPGSAAWAAALQALLSRQGCSGKAADVKWRVIIPDGDRLGPFSAADMQAWLLQGRVPKGLSKQQAAAVAEDPASLQLCGILASDYSAQRLPGAKFYRPLGQLLPAVAGGLLYAAVGKADIAKGVPAKEWNCSPPAAAAPAVSAAAPPPAVQASSKACRGQEQQQQPLQQQQHPSSSATGCPGHLAALHPPARRCLFWQRPQGTGQLGLPRQRRRSLLPPLRSRSSRLRLSALQSSGRSLLGCWIRSSRHSSSSLQSRMLLLLQGGLQQRQQQRLLQVLGSRV